MNYYELLIRRSRPTPEPSEVITWAGQTMSFTKGVADEKTMDITPEGCETDYGIDIDPDYTGLPRGIFIEGYAVTYDGSVSSTSEDETVLIEASKSGYQSVRAGLRIIIA